MFFFFDEPEPLESVEPWLLPVAGRFTSVVGHTFFGDLFLREPDTGEYAILLASHLELVDTGETDELGFKEQLLANPEVVRCLLRPDDAMTLVQRLGTPGKGEAFFPVPLPALGGSGALETFDKGGLWEYLAIVVQSVPLN